MSDRRRAALALGLVLALPGAAVADALKARALRVVDDRCPGGSFAIDPDPRLAGTVTIDGSVGSADRSPDGTVVVGAPCGENGGTARIRVPPDLPIAISLKGDGDLRLGDLRGNLAIDLVGRGLAAGRLAGTLALRTEGDGDVTIGALAGDTAITMRGGGDLSVGAVRVGRLAYDRAGSGDASIGPGAIAILAATLRGSGDLTVAATVGEGSADTAGSGDIQLDRVTGILRRSQAGSGDISVGTDAPATGASDGTDARPSVGDAGIGTVLLAVGLAFASVRLIRRRRRRDPSAPGPRPVGTGAVEAGRRGSGPVETGPDAVGALEARLDAIARRTERIERLVTAEEFDLHRRFRDVDRADARAAGMRDQGLRP